MSEPVVKNHGSLNMVFGLIEIRRAPFRSSSRVYLRLPLRRAHQQLQHHYRRKVQVQHLFHYRLIVREQMSTNGETRVKTQPKIQQPKKMIITTTNGATHLIPKYLNGCRNSGNISWMEALMNLIEPESLFSVTHTRALPMNPI